MYFTCTCSLSETTPTTFGDLIQALSPINDDNDDHMTSDDEGVSGPDMAIADLYASSISMKLMGGAIGDLSHDRIEACLDMLIILTVIKRHSVNCTVSDVIVTINTFTIIHVHVHHKTCTVEPPCKGHLGTWHLVLYKEVVLSLEVQNVL